MTFDQHKKDTSIKDIASELQKYLK